MGLRKRSPRFPAVERGPWNSLAFWSVGSEWVSHSGPRSISCPKARPSLSQNSCLRSVDWNRGPLGPLAGHPLKDKRVRVELEDVAVTLRSNPGRFDAVLLDVDNGPAAFTSADNTRLYNDAGLAALHAALRPEWSARRLVCTGRSKV